MINGKRSGFTLLETLITIAIIGGVGVLLAQIFFTTIRVNTKTEVMKEVRQNGQNAIDVMARNIRSAISVTDTCSDTGTLLNSIQIENRDGDKTTYGCAYDSTNAVTRIASTSAITSTQYSLTSGGVTMGGASCADANMTLVFMCTKSDDGLTTVNISYTLAQKGTPADRFATASERFETTVTLRNN